MASFTIGAAPWPVGQSVSAYPAEAWPDSRSAPAGSATAVAVVSAANTASFTGLADNRRYVAYALGAGVRFSTFSARALSDRDRLTALEATAAVQEPAVVTGSVPALRAASRTGRALMMTNSPGNQDWTGVTYSDYDLIVLHDSTDTARLDAIKVASPSTLVLFYVDLLFAGVPGTDACLLDVAVARSNGWLATTNGTTEIPNPFNTALPQRLLDPGKPGVKEAMAAALAALTASSSAWDGVFLDDVNGDYGEGWTFIPTIQGYSTVTMWSYALQYALEYVKRFFPSLLLIGNLGGWDALPAEMDRIGLVLDGGFKERFAQDNARAVQSTTQIANEAASANKLTAAKKIYFAEVQNTDAVTDTQSVRYGLAAIQAMAEPGYWILGSATQGNYGAREPAITELGRDSGRPLSVFANASGLVSRTFRNYTVQANTTGGTLSGVPALTGVFTAR
jgi:hypothetical protein